MRDILTDLERWRKEDKSIALATVIQTWGSSPRGIGSKMAINADGEFAGSVSGGCVENAVIEAGMQSLKTDQAQLLHFGVPDETAWEVGLACGGSIDVFVRPLDVNFFDELHSIIREEQPVVAATVVRGPAGILGREVLMCDGRRSGSIGDDWDERVVHLASETLVRGTSKRVPLSDEVEMFFDVILPAPTLIMVGGVHIAIALTPIAKTLGYRTIVIDPRGAWANEERFSAVDQLVKSWPEEAFSQVKVTRSTAVVMLTHDPKVDDPALEYSLASPAFYVGALGSQSTQAKRRERLLKKGLTEAQLSHLHAPVGLDIGAQSPEEIALAIMAEIVDVHRRQKQDPVAKEAIEVSGL